MESRFVMYGVSQYHFYYHVCSNLPSIFPIVYILLFKPRTMYDPRVFYSKEEKRVVPYLPLILRCRRRRVSEKVIRV